MNKTNRVFYFCLFLLFSNACLPAESMGEECAPAPPGLISWWKAENNAENSFDGTYDGTLVNGTGFASGKVGLAFSMDGVDDAVHVGMLGNIGLSETQPFSISAWINTNDPATGSQVVAGNYMGEGGATGNFSTYLRIIDSNLVFSIDQRQVDGTSIETAITSGWQHVAATYDGTIMKLYLNGTLMSNLNRTFSGSSDNTRGWDIGNFSPATNSTHGYQSSFNGLIDEVEIFNRALTADEIAASYNAGGAGTCDFVQYDLTTNTTGTGNGSITTTLGGFQCNQSSQNIALNRTVTPLTNSTVTGTPNDIVDGDQQTSWWTYQGPYSEIEFILDLENTVTINTLRFQTLQTENYTIYSSNDGITWTPRHTGSVVFHPPPAPVEITVAGAYSARYLKYHGENNEYAHVGLAEFEVYPHNYFCVYNVELTATPDPGSTFTGWSGDCSGTTSPLTILIDEDKNCTATFTLTTPTTLAVAKTGNGIGTITSNPAGIDCGSTCSAEFGLDSNVTLTATPAQGSIFKGWTGGGCSGTGGCTVTMDEQKDISASFEKVFPWTMFLPAITQGRN